MKALIERYLNEIVGLTIMALMALALVGGQADAEIRKNAAQDLIGIVKIEISVLDR
jgi:hypothetical protein